MGLLADAHDDRRALVQDSGDVGTASNTAWVLLTGIAGDLDVWTRLLVFADHQILAKAEPATMRELVYSLPARLAHHARTRWLRFDRDHPHTDAITTAWHRLTNLTAVT